jgi:hypothetical protein
MVELLVVIAVLAIIAALLLPVLSNAREKGQEITCLDHEDQIAIAAMLYVDDNDGNMCGERMGTQSGSVWPAPPRPNHGKDWTWSYAVLPYTAYSTNSSDNLWTCPTKPPTWSANSEDVDDTVVSSYGISEDTFWGDFGSSGVHSYSIASIKKPAQMIMLGESCWPGPGVSARFLDGTNAWLGYWHLGRGNYEFWDGHGEALRATATVTSDADDCMWGHTFWPHALHVMVRNNARREYR